MQSEQQHLDTDSGLRSPGFNEADRQYMSQFTRSFDASDGRRDLGINDQLDENPHLLLSLGRPPNALEGANVENQNEELTSSRQLAQEEPREYRNMTPRAKSRNGENPGYAEQMEDSQTYQFGSVFSNMNQSLALN